MSEPCDLTALEARGLVCRKELSASELLESCIRRIDRVYRAVNAIVATDLPAARVVAACVDKEVMAGEALGPLARLLIGIKDLRDPAGMPTSFGGPIFAKKMPLRDGRVVRAIRAAGGSVAAKTNTQEVGAGANTRNATTGNAAPPS